MAWARGGRAALFVILGCGALPGAALAQGPVALDWAAPAECPGRDVIVADVAALLSEVKPSERSDAQVRARGEVTREGERFELRLHARQGDVEGERALEAAECGELAEAVALILALMVAPQVAETLGVPPPDGSPASRETPSSESAEALSPASPPPPDPSGAAERGPQEGASPAAEGPVRSDASDGDSTASARRRLTGLDVRVGGLGDVGALPGPTLGPSVQVGVSFGGLRLDVSVGFLGPRHGHVGDAAGPGGRFMLGLLGARVCGAFPEGARWQVGPCAGMEVGLVHGTGVGVPEVDRGRALWWAAKGGVRVQAALGRSWSVALALEAVLPVLRPRFVLEGVGPVHRSAPVGGRADLSLGYHFR